MIKATDTPDASPDLYPVGSGMPSVIAGQSELSNFKEVFLRWFFQHKSDEHFLLIWTLSKDKRQKVSKWFTDLDEATEYATGAIAEGNDVYFGLGLSATAKGAHERCKANEVIALAGFWADIDILGPNHAQTNLPPSIEDARALLAELPLEPTCLVDSGGGLHAYWQFHEIWELDTNDERAKAAQAVADWVDTIRALARRKGWSIDAVKDLARVLRVPGTLNHKTDPPREVKVIACSNRCYEPSDFEDYIIPLAETPGSLFSGTQRPAPVCSPVVIDNITLDPLANPPFEKFQAAFANDEKFKASWERKRRDMTDTSPSAYDMSLASLAVGYDWTDQEITNLLIAARRINGENTKVDRPDYYLRTLQRARERDLGDTGKRLSLSPSAIEDLLSQVSDNPADLPAILQPLSLDEKSQVLNKLMDLDGRIKANRPIKAAARQAVEELECIKVDLQAEKFEAKSGLPVINTTDTPLREQSAKAIVSLLANNIPPELFTQNGTLVRVRDVDELASIEPLDVSRCTFYLARTSEFMRWVRGDFKYVSPPKDVANDILAHPHLPFPNIRGIVESPVLRPDGTILDQPGYDQLTQLFYRPEPNWSMPVIPMNPTTTQVKDALELYREMVCDMPFCDPMPISQHSNESQRRLAPDQTSSWANFLGLLLTPLLRPTIASCIPAALLDAPNPGSGKGLLNNSVTIIATGRITPPTPMPLTEEEMEKKILAALRGGATFMGFDNVDRPIASGVLCSVLTAYPEWETRVLGQSTIVKVANSATWMINGNNLRLGGDMPRRTYRIRLDPKTAMPWERHAFRHPQLLKWVREHRSELLASLFTMIRAWYSANCPAPSSKPPGSFEEWHHQVAGVLEFVGIELFLANQHASFERYDQDGGDWHRFLFGWLRSQQSKKFSESGVTGRELMNELQNEHSDLAEVMPPALAQAVEKYGSSVMQKIGSALAAVEGTRYGAYGLYLERVGKRHGAVRWRVGVDDWDGACRAMTESQDV